MKQILLTGGLGYVGGRIAHALAQETGCVLRLAVRDPGTSKPSWLKEGSLVRLDLSSEEQLREACHNVETVIHLAAVNEIQSSKTPDSALLLNGLGTLKLIQAAEHAGVKRFFYFSTAHVYGSPLVGKITETTLPRPVHPYAITHRTAEDFVLAAHDAHKFFGIVLRLSNAVGAPIRADVNRWTLLVNDMSRQAVSARKLILQSAGLQMRDFIPLSDVTGVVLHFLRLEPTQYGDGLFNVGSGKAMTVIEMATLVASRCEKLLGFTPDIVRPPPPHDAVVAGLDYRIEKLKATGFVPRHDLIAEIDGTLLFCREAFGERK